MREQMRHIQIFCIPTNEKHDIKASDTLNLQYKMYYIKH